MLCERNVLRQVLRQQVGKFLLKSTIPPWACEWYEWVLWIIVNTAVDKSSQEMILWVLHSSRSCQQAIIDNIIPLCSTIIFLLYNTQATRLWLLYNTLSHAGLPKRSAKGHIGLLHKESKGAKKRLRWTVIWDHNLVASDISLALTPFRHLPSLQQTLDTITRKKQRIPLIFQNLKTLALLFPLSEEIFTSTWSIPS